MPYPYKHGNLPRTVVSPNKNLSPDWGERYLTRFHPDLCRCTGTSLWTDNRVSRSPYWGLGGSQIQLKGTLDSLRPYSF